ncbi:MAG: HAD family hydrolase [Candidatus Gallimonas sp.]
MKTLYLTDLDGTLLTRNETVSEYSREVLNRLVDQGMLLTYATARSATSAGHALDGLRLNAPAILYNGGLIYNFHTKETLFSEFFDDALANYVYGVLVNRGIQPFVFGAEGEREFVKWRNRDESAGMIRYLSRRREDARLRPVERVEELLDGDVFYFKCIGARSLLENAWNVLKYDERLICIFHQETYQSDFWMDISPRNATKARAAAFLKKRLNCDRAVCFGDSANDSDMFDVCDEKYAVKNADDWLKAKATGVVGYCEEDGVAKWLAEHSGF